MVDEPMDPVDGSTQPPAPPPDAPEDAAAPAPEAQEPSQALGAQAPLDDKVVSIAQRAKKRRVGSAEEASSSAGAPPPPGSATAPTAGTGGSKGTDGAGEAGPKKRERVIDWGKFNFLAEHFALIYGTDTVWDGSTRMIMKISAMAHAHSGDMVKMWKASERRRTVLLTDVVFDPTEKCGDHCVNLYDGMALEPAEGDVQPMLDLIRFLTSRASDNYDDCDQIMHWLLCWLAYPMQHPGAKLRSAVIMHGDEGAGKNFLFDTVVAIYGKYGALVGQDELEDKFNDWRSAKLFIVGDEVSSRAELVHNKNRLKALITSPTVMINPKNLARREEKNHINIVFLSNELQPLALDNSDRRYLVIYTPRAKDVSYYRQLGRWRDEGGIAAFYHYLLTYPLDGFDPYAPAPLTQAKLDLIDINRKSPERFWSEWSDGQLELPYWSCAVSQAYQAYLKYAQRTGDRFPMQRHIFTRMVTRFSEAMGKPAREKVMKVERAGTKKAERMLLVIDPPADQPQGEWASECVEKFQEHLKVYCGWMPPSPGDGDSGRRGAPE